MIRDRSSMLSSFHPLAWYKTIMQSLMITPEREYLSFLAIFRCSLGAVGLETMEVVDTVESHIGFFYTEIVFLVFYQ